MNTIEVQIPIQLILSKHIDIQIRMNQSPVKRKKNVDRMVNSCRIPYECRNRKGKYEETSLNLVRFSVYHREHIIFTRTNVL
jgi:hypothetical protein